MDQIFYVHDCTSNLIFLDRYVTADKKRSIELSNEQYLQAAKSISASAIIFEVNDCFTRYYYRPFGPHKSLLIGVVFSNGIWKVKEYFENPSGYFLLSLFKKYLLNSSITMYRQNEIADDFFGTKEIVQLGNCV
jgi:hypothetical protein